MSKSLALNPGREAEQLACHLQPLRERDSQNFTCSFLFLPPPPPPSRSSSTRPVKARSKKLRILTWIDTEREMRQVSETACKIWRFHSSKSRSWGALATPKLASSFVMAFGVPVSVFSLRIQRRRSREKKPKLDPPISNQKSQHFLPSPSYPSVQRLKASHSCRALSL